MEKDRIETLLDKYRRGEITSEESAFLESWYAQYQEPGGNDYDAGHLLEDSMLVKKSLRRSILPVSRRRYLPYAAAAIVFIALTASLYFYQDGSISNKKKHHEVVNGILPGSNKATLTLGGKTIDLSRDKRGIIIKADELYYNDGSVVDPDALPDSTVTRYAVLSTPRGGQYKVQLQDGTKVWLNAYSSLKYPSSFDGLKERRVILTGEAYFEVARNQSKPFLVSTAKQTMEVLGTHFNIKSYTGEPAAETTLLEGSLRVISHHKSATASDDSRILRPGQQAIFSGEKITVKEVDTDNAVAWKNGYFQFNHKNLEAAMTEVSRWYDIEVEFRNDAIRKRMLAGTISKYASISQVLEKMELTGVMDFRIAGRKVIVE